MKKFFEYSKNELPLIFLSVFKGGIGGLFVRGLLFCWLLWLPYAFYFLVVFGIATIDLITGIWAAKKTKTFSWCLLRSGIIDKSLLYVLLLTTTAFLEALIKHQSHYNGNWLLWFVSIIVGTYDATSVCRHALVINPRLTFLIRISNLFQAIPNKIEHRIDNIL